MKKVGQTAPSRRVKTDAVNHPSLSLPTVQDHGRATSVSAHHPWILLAQSRRHDKELCAATTASSDLARGRETQKVPSRHHLPAQRRPELTCAPSSSETGPLQSGFSASLAPGMLRNRPLNPATHYRTHRAASHNLTLGGRGIYTSNLFGTKG